eukprot:9497066-Pyramimonas_sp.AAC.1
MGYIPGYIPGLGTNRGGPWGIYPDWEPIGSDHGVHGVQYGVILPGLRITGHRYANRRGGVYGYIPGAGTNHGDPWVNIKS